MSALSLAVMMPEGDLADDYQTDFMPDNAISLNRLRGASRQENSGEVSIAC
jgi:hypothetical protein